MSIITRFAPSPTGFLHVGNVRMALINYLLAKKFNGKFILRIDDTDYERSTQEYEQAIKEDLRWLGFSWNSTFKQSEKIDIYNVYLNKLKDQGLIYPCYETKKELEYKRKIQLAKGYPPLYDRSALQLTNKQKQEYENEGRKPYYRFKVSEGSITWNDLIKGEIKIEGNNLSDPVLIKENGVYLYSFCSVVDDIENNITHIIRGEDHISNTAIHLQLFRGLGFLPPQIGHMSLLSMLDGSELSKRKGSNSIKDLRMQGIHPLAVLNYLFMLGQSEQNNIYKSIPSMMKDFDLKNYSKSLVKFDNNKLYQINGLVLQSLEFKEVSDDLKRLNIDHITEDIWDLFKSNLNSLNEINKYYNAIFSENTYKTNNKELIRMALNYLPEDEFTEELIKEWINNIAKQLAIKKKEIFLTLREVLTGSSSGPNFKDILIAIGLRKVKERLENSL